MTSITVVDNLEVSSEQIEEAIQMWDTFEDYISSKEGFISAKLVRAHDSSSKFNIVIISEWESKAHFDAATIVGTESESVGSSAVEYNRYRTSYYTVRNV